MLVSEMIAQIKDQVHDISNEFSDDLLIKFINTAIKSASYLLANVNHNSVMAQITVTSGSPIPADFIKFAGQYPVTLIQGVFDIYDTRINSLDVTYYEAKPSVALVTDTIPFTDELTLLYIEQYASILALNRDEANVGADEQIITALKNEYISTVTGIKG